MSDHASTTRPDTQVPIFVLSSGRAGSTLLARMIHSHPSLLCVSDIFEPVGREPYFDRQRLVSGAEFFAVLSRPSLPQRIRYWRERPTAELLYLPADDQAVSLLMTYTLPFLTGGDPRTLFDEVRQAVERFPEQSMADHLIAFFDWLRDRFGRELWVERTGGSLPHAREIVATWPHARFVHSFRDPRETAISMLTGSFFCLYLELTKNPKLGEWDADHMPPVEEMGALLDGWVIAALAALEEVPTDRQMNVAYESLLDDAEGTLLDLATFLLDRAEPTAEDRAWAEEQCQVIRRPRLRFPDLPPAERQRLTDACQSSLEALRYGAPGRPPA